MPIATVNPATGETLKTFDAAGRARRSSAGSPPPRRAFRDYRTHRLRRAGRAC